MGRSLGYAGAPLREARGVTALAVVGFDPLQDVRHLRAKSARELADFKAWLEIEEKAPRTLDAYERTIAALLVMFPSHAIGEFTDGDLLHFLTQFPKKSRRIEAIFPYLEVCHQTAVAA